MSKKSKNLVSLNHLPGILLASQAECERWIEAGLIPVAERRTVQKHGRNIKEPMFDPEVVAQLAAEVPAWREHGDERGRELRSDARRREGGRSADPSHDDAAHRRRQSILAPVRKNTGIYIAEDIRRIESGRWKPERVFAGYRAVFSQPMQVLPDSDPIEIAIEFAFAEPVEVATVTLAPARVERTELAAASETLESRLIELRDATFEACEQELAGWRDELETYLDAFEDADERQAILGGIRAALEKLERIHGSDKGGPAGAARKLRQRLDDYRSKAAARRLRHLREAQIREASGYERYAAIFPVARSLNRRFLFLAGPTNSGKTYEALKLAREAGTAEILSPLRLLALEHFERMSEEGLPAGMVTGEERVLPEGATHIARTIETLDLHRVVDVCVIDEVQMLGDPSRGWAWTQAMIGAPARLVVLTGAPEAIPLVEHLLAMTGEPLEVKILKRKGRLRVEGVPANLNKLMRGDAVVAFTRRDVHDLRTRLVQSGRTVATVYGALGPEVRRAEAARFRNGEAEILVATDAIGMGLNIGPLRRVVFSTLRKYDGVRDRQLTAMEIKQIAGRAGRFGHHDEGLVTALPDVGGYAQVEKIIGQALTGDAGKLRGKAYVRPNQETVLSASEVLQTDRLGRVLQHLYDTLVAGHPDLRMADMDEMISLATLLDTVDMPILNRLSYSMAPVDGREQLAMELILDWARQHARDGRVQAPDFGFNTDLLKLEARVKIATSWLWLAQRYPDVFEDPEAVVDLRASLNAKIEEKLVDTSVSHRRKPEDKARRERGKTPQKQRKNRRRRSDVDVGETEQHLVRRR
ncbi:helicase-related protein [Microvirga sp. CF3062]|uniref:helicase-related protein n=1 Tax=Microvirga sp. CF3062 TaxID=3110182 RepID=UPI002E790C19|nr:helicase-related protein [Microvirga sp. CF3062]MEE1657695.1 helicase-related protein [Microvirga sp. CF3062]